MTLLRALLVSAAVAAVGAAPAGPPVQTQPVYKCCRESLLGSDSKDFQLAPGVDSLDACKTFCKSNKYGSPVYRGSGWGCTTDAGFKCREVDRDLCKDILADSKGFFRLYPLSSLETIKEEVTKTSRGTSSSTVKVEDDDDGKSTRDLLGGRASDAFATRGGAETTTTLNRVDRIGQSTLIASSFNFDGKPTSVGGDFRGVNLGRTGEATIISTETNRTKNVTDNTVIARVNENASGSVQDVTQNGIRAFQRTNARGSATIEGDDKLKTKTDTRISSVNISVGGTATFDTKSLVADLPSTSLGITTRLDTNLRAVSVRENSLTSFGGTGRQNIRTRDSSSSVGLRESHGRAELTEKKTDAVGQVTQTSRKDGETKSDTDQTVLSKDGVGTIDHTTKKTTGVRNNVTTTVDVADARTTVNKTTECPECTAVGRQTIRSRAVKDTILKAKNKFNDTKVTTVTSALGGPTLLLGGQTRNEQSDTMEDTQTSARVIKDHSGTSQANCDKKTGRCQQTSQRSGKEVTTSKNFTVIHDNVDKKTQKIIVQKHGSPTKTK